MSLRVLTIGIKSSSFTNNLTTGRKIPEVVMDNLESCTRNGIPIFDGTNYAFWKVRMRIYLMVKGSKFWDSMVTGYSATTNPPIDVIGKKLVEKHAKATNAILSRFMNYEFMKVM